MGVKLIYPFNFGNFQVSRYPKLTAIVIGVIFAMNSQAQTNWGTDGNVADSSSFIGTKNAACFRLKSNNLERMRISANGNIGLGTAIPTERLDVNGNISLTGDLFVREAVTQRTDFKEVTIEPNAEVQFVACKAIHIKPGFHAKAGSKFHAKIDMEHCAYCVSSGLAPVKDKTIRDLEQEKENEFIATNDDTNPVRVYPNPGIERVTLEVLDKHVTSFDYTVYDIAGKLIGYGTVEGNLTQLDLEKGVYIVRTKINESWYVRKLVMQ
jgi:hypothetical protein